MKLILSKVQRVRATLPDRGHLVPARVQLVSGAVVT